MKEMPMPIQMFEPEEAHRAEAKKNLERQIEADKEQVQQAKDMYSAALILFRDVFGYSYDVYKPSFLEKGVANKFIQVIEERKRHYEKLQAQLNDLQDQYYKVTTAK